MRNPQFYVSGKMPIVRISQMGLSSYTPRAECFVNINIGFYEHIELTLDVGQLKPYVFSILTASYIEMGNKAWLTLKWFCELYDVPLNI